MGATPLITTNNPQNTRSTKPDQASPQHLHPQMRRAGFAPLGASLRRVAGVSRLYWCNSPVWRRPRRGPSSTVHLSQHNSFRLVAVRSRFGAVRSRFGTAWRPKCRPPRRKTPTTGCRGRSGLRFGQNYLGHGGSLAREPAIACANRLYRTSTRYSVSGRGCPRSH